MYNSSQDSTIVLVNAQESDWSNPLLASNKTTLHEVLSGKARIGIIAMGEKAVICTIKDLSKGEKTELCFYLQKKAIPSYSTFFRSLADKLDRISEELTDVAQQ